MENIENEKKVKKNISNNKPDTSDLLKTLAIIGFILILAKLFEVRFATPKNMVPLVPMSELVFNGVIHVINFLILAFLLRKYLFTPIMDFMDKRKELIETEINEAKELKKESIEIVNQTKDELANTQKKSSEIISSAINEAEKTKNDIINDAKEKAVKIIDETEVKINQQKNIALKELKEEIGEIACSISEKLIHKTINHQDQEEIIKKAINELRI
jgi:F-type H+-transporting ATPase subunit b